MYRLMDIYAWNILLSIYHSKVDGIPSISSKYILLSAVVFAEMAGRNFRICL